MEKGLKDVCMCWFSLARRGAAKARWGRHTRTRREVEGRRPNRTCASITHVEASFRRPSSNEGIELKSRVFFDTPLLRHVFRPPGPADALPCADPLQIQLGANWECPKVLREKCSPRPAMCREPSDPYALQPLQTASQGTACVEDL